MQIKPDVKLDNIAEELQIQHIHEEYYLNSNGDDWYIRPNISNYDLAFAVDQNDDDIYTEHYKLNGSGTPTDNADLITKAYADATYSIGAHTPAAPTATTNTETSGITLTGSTSGSHTIGTQSIKWTEWGKICQFVIEINNINSTSVGTLNLSIAGISGFPTPDGFSTFNVITDGMGGVNFTSVQCRTLGNDTWVFAIQTIADDSNNGLVSGASFGGSEDIYISGSFLMQ